MAREAWVKNHPLEGDGLLINFYNYMWKKNKNYESCPGVLVPDTVVYDHNFPRGWFTYERVGRREKGELKKKQGKELDTSSIWEVFKRQPDPSIDIVASYMYAREDSDTGETQTCVEFFDRDGLGEFLNNRKDKREGVLQKFLLPKGANNTMIQVVWSPRVCIMQRKTNTHALSDRNHAPYVRAVTYEGASHHCDDGICAPKTTSRIKAVCNNVCVHFNSTEHGKVITRMVLYFKVDRADNVWLLWCGSVRISDRQARSKMPVNMAPIFSSPDARPAALLRGQGGHETAEDVLQRVDHDQLRLGHDHVHYRACCKSPTASPTSRSRREDAQAYYDAPGDTAGGADEGQQNADARLRRRIATLREDWMRVAPVIEQEWNHIVSDRSVALTLIDDVFYEAYSHFQTTKLPFFFALPGQLRALLGEAEFEELVADLRLERVPADEFPEQTFGELDFWIRDRSAVPISKVSGQAAGWLRRFYDARIQHLKERAMPFAEQAAIQVAKEQAAEEEKQNLASAEDGDEAADEASAAGGSARESASQGQQAPSSGGSYSAGGEEEGEGDGESSPAGEDSSSPRQSAPSERGGAEDGEDESDPYSPDTAASPSGDQGGAAADEDDDYDYDDDDD
eukprot:TRINITY_DN8273_c0_g1_i1.p1 TRINITY_DN8273_c0_g1~~TRINITY_DN8273_c0_g1_i1.p1  ORF type:complete len:625 (+),score=226.12 TRINITY_DN8273_c0_g1_i1:154-2028(+)